MIKRTCVGGVVQQNYDARPWICFQNQSRLAVVPAAFLAAIGNDSGGGAIGKTAFANLFRCRFHTRCAGTCLTHLAIGIGDDKVGFLRRNVQFKNLFPNQLRRSMHVDEDRDRFLQILASRELVWVVTESS